MATATLSRMGHKPGLYVSEQGETVCAEHAPYKGTDTWRFGHYMTVTEAIERIWLETAPAPRCESCRKTRSEAVAA